MALILGIETSCDETAAAIVADGRFIRSNVVASQEAVHARYGGIFPEVASRIHIEAIVPVIEEAMAQAGVGWADLVAIGVTYGPGLAGSLLVGVNMAKALVMAHNLPLMGVNHLEAHVYSNWLVTTDGRQELSDEETWSAEPVFPALCLVVSGGHTELVLLRGHGDYQVLGRTLDDAAGEAFDKVARLLGLGYPGGPAIQRASQDGSPTAFEFPRAWLDSPYDFSFSGLKTAVLRTVQALQGDTVPTPGRRTRSSDAGTAGEPLPVADLAASFQEAVVDVLTEKTRLAAAEFQVREVLLAGGVAANLRLRQLMGERIDLSLRYPPLYLCTDNAAMVAAAAHFRLQTRLRADPETPLSQNLDLDVVPSLSLA